MLILVTFLNFYSNQAILIVKPVVILRQLAQTIDYNYPFNYI